MRAVTAAALYGTLGSLVLSALAVTPAGGVTAAARTAPAPPVPAPPAPDAPTAVPPVAPPAAPPSVAWSPEEARRLVPTPLPTPKRLAFGPCSRVEKLPSSVECATLTVPLDYAHPDGKQIHLTVSRGKATGTAKQHQGALVYNPGGPGGSGMSFPLLAKAEELKNVARAYDFVGYAPRGVGRSAPLSCQEPKEFAEAPTDSRLEPSEAFKRHKAAEARAYAEGCARNAGSALRHYNTLNNARDLEMLRAALGEEKLTFMGASYGTYFGAVYATLFPQRVRRMVFDSVVNPDPAQIWYRNNLDQNVAFERRWRDWRTWVAEHDATYHLGKTPREVARSYETARNRLRRAPAGGKVGPAQLQAAFLEAGYNDRYWPERAKALSAYLKGDAKPLIEQAAPMPDAASDEENGNAVYTAVECNDAPWPRDWPTWNRDNSVTARVAPFATWDNAWMNLPCAFWPTGAPTDAAADAAAYARRGGGQPKPVDVRTAPGALPPVLLLAAQRDGATPYSGALELQRRLPGSALVTERDAGTHGIAFGDNTCVNRHTEEYLLTGRVPKERNAYCAPREEPKP